MRESVRRAFVAFSAPLEGVVAHMYLDVKGLVTTAIGILIDPMSMALGLPFRRPGGALATRDEIAAEWQRLKADPNAAKMGHRYAARITTLRLDDRGIEDVVATKLEANDALLRQRFPEWESWPADAQLATHSMAWACGPAFRFPRLEAALRARDFAAAANECQMSTAGNPGIVPRNARNRVLYRNAAAVAGSGGTLSPDVLYWPADMETAPVDHDAETVPDLDAYRAEQPAATVTVLPDTIAGIHCQHCGLASCDGNCLDAA
ncbi:MAG TPA: hypothetical protein VM430_08205 [Microbacterium sp.]|nr:hypothetical protein [Microbacterium sp.]